MSEPPPPPKLQRQRAVSVATPYHEAFNEVSREWKHAKQVYPEYFPDTIYMNGVRLDQDIRQNILDDLSPWMQWAAGCYKIGEYVGKVYTSTTTGEPLLTAKSYETYDQAILESCYMAKDAVRTMLRHILYIEHLVSEDKIGVTVNTILEYGIYPSSDSDHAPANGYHPPE
jgi:hypothetical protein